MVVIGYSPAILILIASIIIVYSNEAYRTAETFGVCEISGATFPIINEMIRGVQLGTTIIGVLLYIPITVKLIQVFRPNSSFANLNPYQRRNLLRYNCIVSLMVANELFLIVIPHIILIFWPDTDARYVLFVSNLVKGLVNVAIIFFPQKELRNRCFKALMMFLMRLCCVDSNSAFTMSATQVSQVTAFKKTVASRRGSDRNGS
uniref:G protein-coupled receptor n=1 Tax=Acrobeloides nanus TaxID=290746 RepID=A0A914CLI3_9BILA